VHGVAGGVLSSLRGANFGNGFWAAGATQALSPQIDKVGGGVPGRVAAAALIGGTVSAATGGKFANGAETSAFQELFNATTHSGDSTAQSTHPKFKLDGLALDPDLVNQAFDDIASHNVDSISSDQELNKHGDVVYLTDSEQHLIDAFKAAAGLSGCLAAVCIFRVYGWKKPRY
jgi:hypothetical protein